MSVTGLRLKYTGLRITYLLPRVAIAPLMIQLRAMAILRSRTQRAEVNARTGPEMVNYSTKGSLRCNPGSVVIIIVLTCKLLM